MTINTEFDLGQVVYKICPKCNNEHNGTCEHCAWRYCLGGCDVGVWIYDGGSFNEHPLQIVPYKATETSFFTIKKYWNIMFFNTENEAIEALQEYDEIRKIEDKSTRVEKFNLWVAQRQSEVEE